MTIKTWRKYPICLAGFDIRRWEIGPGLAVLCEPYTKKFIFWKQSLQSGPSGIQYKSPFGFLLTWPLCLYIWYQFRPQQINKMGYGIPGSEKVLYFRIGIARWDITVGYMVPTLYLGGHYD